MRTMAVMMLLLAGLSACSREKRAAESGTSDANIAAPAAAPAPAGAVSDMREQASAPAATPAPAQGGNPSAVPAPTPRMIVRTGTATIKVKTLADGIREVRAVAQRLGGYVGNQAVQAGDNQTREATLQLKIPSTRFDEAVAALSAAGKVESVQVNAEDVGEEFVDVNARLENARRLEERLINLLATRTGKLEDVLMVERELARVREDIDRLAGRSQFLQHQVALSTLNVTVHEPTPLGTPGDNRILDALRTAWRNFVGAIAYMIELFGALLPIAVVAGAVAWVILLVRRRHRTAAQP